MTDARPGLHRPCPTWRPGALGGSVVFATDELFAEKENLIKPEPPVFAPAEFGNRGKVYDGWETRRHRAPEHDHAIVRLGHARHRARRRRGHLVLPRQLPAAGIGGGGRPPTGTRRPAELAAMAWQTLVSAAGAQGRLRERLPGGRSPSRWTHVRLSIYPDGGVARFRVHGIAAARPALPGRHRRPGRPGERRPGGRLLGRVLRLGRQPDPARPGRRDGRGLGERAAARPGPRLRDRRAGRGPGCCATSRSTPRASSATPPTGSGCWPRTCAAGERGERGVAGSAGSAGARRRRERGSAAGVTRAPDPAWREVLPLTRVQPDTRHRFGWTAAWPPTCAST